MGVILARPNRSAASSDATGAGRSGGGGGACGVANTDEEEHQRMGRLTTGGYKAATSVQQ
jgi:hypothetical protein